MAASGISGSLGHGVAFLSLDDEFIRQRQQRSYLGRTNADSSGGLRDELWRGVVEPLRGDALLRL